MVVTDQGYDVARLPRFYGLSTDTKPVDNTTIGAKFHETDTGKEFIYSGAEWIRLGLKTVEQADLIELKPVIVTDDLLTDILTELRINNAHLALVTGDEINEEDIDGND